MKQFLVLVLLFVVVLVNASAQNSNKNSVSKLSRKRLLVNLLHALRTLRDHKKVKSTRIAFTKLNYVHLDKHHKGPALIDHVSPITKTIDDMQTARSKSQISKRSRGIHKDLAGGQVKKPRNSKELFLQLLQTLKGLKKVKNRKPGQRTYSSKNELKHATRTKQKIQDNFSGSMSHSKHKFLDFDQRSSLLKPVKKIAKIGTSQTSKARYSFSKARLSFLQALETAQDEKLTKLGNLEKKFSYILPRDEGSNRQNVGAKVNYALQDFAKDQSATALSHIHHPYKKLANKPSQSAKPIKHSQVGEPLKKQVNLPNPIIQKQHKVAPVSTFSALQNGMKNQRKIVHTTNTDLKSRYKNKKKPNRLFPSMVDELLSISNARSKLEKLKRLRKLRAKLLNNKFSEESTKKQINTNYPYDGKKTSITGAAGINVPNQKLTGENEITNDYKTSQKVVYDKPSKRQQNVQTDGNGHVLKAVEYKDAFDDLVNHTHDRKEPIHSIPSYSNSSSSSSKLGLDSVPGNYSLNANGTVQNAQDKTANFDMGGISTALPGKINKSGEENYLNTHHLENPSQHAATGNENRPVTSLNGTNDSSTMEDKINETHITGLTPSLEKQNSSYLADLGRVTAKNFSESRDINTDDKTSNKSRTGPEKDQSYLPLDRTSPQTESNDFKNPLSSVVSEHDKIISELTSSKILAKHLSNNNSKNSHKTLAKVLQQAQDIFLKKVKQILAGNKTNGKDRDNSNQDGNQIQDNSGQKPKGVINTSAYVMDESPPNVKSTANVEQDNSGIVPKTPTNDDLANSLNREISPLPLSSPPKNPGMKPMQAIQTPMDPSPPLIEQPAGQSGQAQGHPVSGQPLTYTQLQDAHEEERVALQQENAFRSMQNGVNAPLNDANAPTTSANTPFQSYVGSNQLPPANHYSVHTSGFHAPNIDDLSEYRGGMERYQLSHRIGYDGDTEEQSEDDYVPRHHFHLYRHRFADDEDDENYNDDDDDDDDFDEDGEKKSKIGKPHHFKTPLNSSRIDHIKREKVHFKSTLNKNQ